MKCDLCLCPITKEEIEAYLTFGFQHPCGRYGNYHSTCAMNVLDRMGVKLSKPQGEKEGGERK